MIPVQFITHATERYSYLDSARLALDGGCRWIQLRMKDATPEQILPVAEQMLDICNACSATLIIDDHVDIAEQIKAHGVHLGKNDMPVSQARQRLGEAYIIGGTANTFEDIAALAAAGADYIGCGPYRFTTTKKNLSPILGLEGYRDIMRRMREEGITLPVVAIGGIGFDDITHIMSTGVNGIALSGSVLRAEDPASEMRRILAL